MAAKANRDNMYPGKATHHDAYGNPIAGSYSKRYDNNGDLVRDGNAYDAYGNPIVPPVKQGTRTHGPSPYARTPAVFQQVEDMIIENFNSDAPGSRLDWQEVEGCWVLRPPARAGPPQAVAMFLGAAFVGAAPEISYRLMLEALTARGVLVRATRCGDDINSSERFQEAALSWRGHRASSEALLRYHMSAGLKEGSLTFGGALQVVAVPYATSFDHLRIADEVQYKFDRCMKGIDPEVQGLPIYGVGHSLGALLTLLINSRFAVHRDGNALISFTNRPATDVIPFLSPILAPGAALDVVLC